MLSELQQLKNLQEIKRETENVILNFQLSAGTFFKKNGVEDKLKQQALFDRDVTTVMNAGARTIVGYLGMLLMIFIRNYSEFFNQALVNGSEFNKDIFIEAQA